MGKDAIGLESANGTAERLLATAAKLFRTKGYAATGIREIAAGVGIESASLYHHVGKKEDLLRALCVDTLTKALHGLVEALNAETDPIERARALIRVHVVTGLTNQDMHTATLMELRSLSSERRAEVLRLRRGYEAAVRQTIEDLQAAGALRNDIPAKHLTLNLLALLNWPVLWYRPNGGMTPAQIADHIASIFLDGSRRSAARPPRAALGRTSKPASRRPSTAKSRRPTAGRDHRSRPR